MLDLTEELTGSRLTLKRSEMTFDFAKKVFALVDSSRNHLLPFLEWAIETTSAEDSYNYILQSDKEWNEKTSFVYAIFNQDVFVGYISAIHISAKNKSAEFGYWIGQEFAGHGYAQESVKILEKHLFEKGFNRLTIRADAQNHKSQNVAIKCGFTQEGVFKQSAYSPITDTYRDISHFAKLKSEYKNA